MDADRNDGGPAFPSHGSMGEVVHEGKSLRDDFAGTALLGLMGRVWEDPATGKVPENVFEIWAGSSYAIADAMLAERAK